ncbi:MAG: twin-arginine translocase subunit TatC [Candidatus Zixiibacteriota bacterium]
MTTQRDPREMSFWDHVEELRKRLIRSLAAILIISIVSYVYSDWLIELMTRHIETVYFMGPTEAFAVKIKVSLFAGLILAIPVVLYQLWQFVVPGLYAHEVKLVIPVVIFASLFFVGGAAFCYFLVLPVGMEFLLGFGTEKMKPLISVGQYISFVGWMTVAFGVVFQMPIVFFFLGRMGIVSSATLRRGRRYAVISILIVAAAVTPSPDVFSQLMLAGPLYVLYEASVILVRLTGRRELPHPRASD